MRDDEATKPFYVFDAKGVYEWGANTREWRKVKDWIDAVPPVGQAILKHEVIAEREAAALMKRLMRK